jgi:phospholipid/cholesterol/gamma-HCH transport system substrate-binding protein
MTLFATSCFGILLYLWGAFGGPVPLKPRGYRLEVSFSEATLLAEQAEVRISGVPVGRVARVERSADGRTTATLELARRYAPLPSDARAVLRAKSLLGETYVELTPGRRHGVPPLSDGGRLPRGQVAPTVELDEILRSFDARTRQAVRTWFAQQATAVHGRSRDISDILANAAGFETDATTLLGLLDAQDGDVRRLVDDTGTVFAALTQRGAELRRLLRNGDRALATFARRHDALAGAFRALPTFEQESRKTVLRLERFWRSSDPLTRQLRPAARELAPVTRSLTTLAPQVRGLFGELDGLEAASQRGLPALTRVVDMARPLTASFGPALDQLAPALGYLGAYRSDLISFIVNATAATQAKSIPTGRSSPVHYLRAAVMVGPEGLAHYPRPLPTVRSNAYQPPGAYVKPAQPLRVADTRFCGPDRYPTLASTPLSVPGLDDLVRRYVLQDGQATAPPCLPAPLLPGQGRFPHVPALQHPNINHTKGDR